MNLKQALITGALGLLSLGLFACRTTDTPADVSSSLTDDPSSSSVGDASSSSLAEWVDYAHDGTVVLNLDYEGKSFATDGIEKVTLRTCIDGDTAHFDPTVSTKIGDLSYIKARFYGIDTPESTGKVQPYGRGASKYTKSILKEADENGTIVVSTPQDDYGAPTPDSTGSRYVSLVWVNTEKKDAPREELYLLNLMIVQDGWSWVKNVSDVPEYVDTFYAAETQAKNHKLNLFSGEDDPDFNYGDYVDVSLLDLRREIEASMADSEHVNAYDNANVRVVGAVAGYSNNILYLQDFCYEYNEDGSEKVDENGDPIGAYAGINIFVGMSSIPSKFTEINTYISVCGVASDSENFGFQISGANFPRVSYSDNDAQVLLKAAENTEEHSLYTFNYTADELDKVAKNESHEYECLNCAVNITDTLTVTGGYTSDDGEMTLYVGHEFNIYLTFPLKPDPNDTAVLWRSHEKFVGHTITIKGVFGFHKNTSGVYKFQLLPSDSTDLIVTDYAAS